MKSRELKNYLLEKLPLGVEVYCYLTRKSRIAKVKRANERFAEKSVQELMAYDAMLYKRLHGGELDWHKLKGYTEKMQWAKLFDKDERKQRLSDKYLVRDWVSERIGSEYLIPLLGVWDDYSQIDFSSLPERFVMKTNRGSADVILVKDYSKLSLSRRLHMRRILTESLVCDYSSVACEMHYSGIQPKIIAEAMIGDGVSDLADYKFMCFDGQAKYCWVDVGRFSEHKRNLYDINWVPQTWRQNTFKPIDYEIQKPENYEKMVELAEKLAQGFSHVRVDLYNVDGKIYFGEMTFSNAAGFAPIYPQEVDVTLGDMWKLDTSELPVD